MTPDRKLVLAADGGNTKTAVAVADLDGQMVGSAIGGPSDIYVGTSTDWAIDAAVDATRTALDSAGAAPEDVATAVFSMAGADWPEDFVLLRTELATRLGLPSAPLVVNDAIGGLRSGAPLGEGIAVVCGTFNAVGARHRDGRTFHCGFWPDRTGGWDLGTEALKAVYRDGLGLGPPTALTAAALAMFEAGDALELMHAFTRREHQLPPWDVQRLTPTLLDCASDGDEVAAAIVREAGTWLGEEGRVSAERVGLDVDGTPVVLSGGVLQHPTTMLADSIMDRLPGGVPTQPEVPPLVGALLLGFDALAIPMEGDRLATGLDDSNEGRHD